MVFFSIGAHVLDTLLYKTTGLVTEALFGIATWSAKSMVRIVWTPPLTDEQRLRIEVKELRDELYRLESSLEKIEIHDGEEYLLL